MRWLTPHFRIRYILTPLATLNTKHNVGVSSYLGYSDWYVFGFRVARIHRTMPWA